MQGSSSGSHACSTCHGKTLLQPVKADWQLRNVSIRSPFIPPPRPSLSLHHCAHPSKHLLVPPAGEPVRFRRCTTSKASLIISSSLNQTTSCTPQLCPATCSHLAGVHEGGVGGSVLKRKPPIKAGPAATHRPSWTSCVRSVFTAADFLFGKAPVVPPVCVGGCGLQ